MRKRADWRVEDGQFRSLPRLRALDHPPVIHPGDLEWLGTRAEALAENRFVFLNREKAFGPAIDWTGRGEGKLWRFNLHYFNYLEPLILLRLGGGRGSLAGVAYREFRRLTTDWMQGNEVVGGDGWHPYTLSLRLVNWIEGMRAFEDELAGDPEHKARLVSGIIGQARVLSSSLELDLRGNHLLENLRALVLASMVIPTPEAEVWGRRAWDLLEVELEEQVKADGGHFERCPGYHVLVVQHLLDIVRWGRELGYGLPGWFEDRVLRMLGFLASMRTPDGRIPLLKDSSHDAYPSVDQVLQEGYLLTGNPGFLVPGMEEPGLRLRAYYDCKPSRPALEANRSKGPRWLAGSGYLRSDSGDGGFFVMDFGAPCPDYLPGHAHADLFTFELWAHGMPWFVDSGVYEYTEGPWRDFFRSTAAHNTVEINGLNQSDVYGAFRVGRRARVRDAGVEELGGGWVMAQAFHDGYGHHDAWHRRVALLAPFGCWVVVDVVSGPGARRIISRLQLHPGASMDELGVGGGRLSQQGRGLEVKLAGFTGLEVGEGWHSDEFGEKERTKVIQLQMAPGGGVGVIGMAEGAGLGVEMASGGPGGAAVVRVTWRGTVVRLEVPRDARLRVRPA